MTHIQILIFIQFESYLRAQIPHTVMSTLESFGVHSGAIKVITDSTTHPPLHPFRVSLSILRFWFWFRASGSDSDSNSKLLNLTLIFILIQSFCLWFRVQFGYSLILILTLILQYFRASDFDSYPNLDVPWFCL